ncbi:unnamed protein product [Camellia sinensis]
MGQLELPSLGDSIYFEEEGKVPGKHLALYCSCSNTQSTTSKLIIVVKFDTMEFKSGYCVRGYRVWVAFEWRYCLRPYKSWKIYMDKHFVKAGIGVAASLLRLHFLDRLVSVRFEYNGVVSCADILAIVARDVVVLAKIE